MSKSNKFDLKQVEKKAHIALQNCIVEAGNTAKNFFVESFRKQGWDDRSVTKWEKRKKVERKGRGSKKTAAELGTVRSVKAGRAILVKSGDLRRSIIRHNANRAAMSIKITSDLPYSKIHNEGGVINKSATGGKILSFDKKGRFAKSRTEKQRGRVSYQQKVNIGAYTIKIPPRKFMGESFNLNNKVKQVIIKRLNKVFE
jgi:phage gpG-like protein